jgi:hypothetical protein
MAGSNDRAGKRSRFGNRQQRGVWRLARGYKHSWYGTLCQKADRLNNRGGSDTRVEAKLDRRLQARFDACATTNDKVSLYDALTR